MQNFITPYMYHHDFALKKLIKRCTNANIHVMLFVSIYSPARYYFNTKIRMLKLTRSQ